MGKKILVINNSHYNHCTATLMEGLIENKDEYGLELFATTPYNYAAVKNKWDYVVYSKEVVSKLSEICDVVVFGNDVFSPTIISDEVKKEKGVYCDSNDYGDYLEKPSNYKFYIKRELAKNQTHLENVYPFWFAAENRYYYRGRDFEKLWDDKTIPLSCMMGIDEMKPWRLKISDALKYSFGTKEGWVLDPVYGGVDDSALDTGGRHWSNFFNTLADSKISVDSYGAGLANNTGRFFESIACGCCLFYQPITTYTPNPFTADENIVLYNSTAQLVEKINDTVGDDKKMKDIAYAGFEHVLNHHTTKHRGVEFLELCKTHNLI